MECSDIYEPGMIQLVVLSFHERGVSKRNQKNNWSSYFHDRPRIIWEFVIDEICLHC